jgi:phosphoglycolate phosphatase
VAISTVLFDFDGTLVQTFPAIIDILNRRAHEFGYPPLTATTVQHLRATNTRDILQQSGLSTLQLLWLAYRVRTDLYHQLPDLPPVEGIQPALHQLHQQGYRLGIVTSNSLVNVRRFLNLHHWTPYFQSIDSSIRLLGKHQTLRRICDRNQLPTSTVAYVGDETRDIEAANHIGLTSIAVTWGFNSTAILKSSHPTHLVEQPSNLLQSISP